MAERKRGRERKKEGEGETLQRGTQREKERERKKEKHSSFSSCPNLAAVQPHHSMSEREREGGTAGEGEEWRKEERD